MNYILEPTLEHIALVKVAATLWNQDDVKDLLEKFCIPIYLREIIPKWEKIESVVINKVAELPLPKQMKEKILCLIRPVGFEIIKWSEFLDRGCNLSVDLPNEFYWTPQGTIDRKKTAEVMTKDMSIDVTTRYKLACIFCLEDDIPKLWEEIPKNCRKSFYSQEDPMHVMQKELVVLWTYQINEDTDKLNSIIERRMEQKCSPYEYAFEVSAIDGNKVAVDYFFQKLTSAEREEALVATAKCVAYCRTAPVLWDLTRTDLFKESYSDIFFFLLSQLNEEKQLKVFKTDVSDVLKCLLDWPWQNFFMETANRLWKFYPKFFYPFVFTRVIGKIILGYKDFNYQMLFRECWKQTPQDYKRYVLSHSPIQHIVSDLFQIRDKDCIKLIFEDATLKNKKFIIYSDEAKNICKELINHNQLNLLNYFIKECLPTKDEVIEFKEYFENGVVLDVNEYLLSNWRRKFLHMLDEIIFEREKK